MKLNMIKSKKEYLQLKLMVLDLKHTGVILYNIYKTCKYYSASGIVIHKLKLFISCVFNTARHRISSNETEGSVGKFMHKWLVCIH